MSYVPLAEGASEPYPGGSADIIGLDNAALFSSSALVFKHVHPFAFSSQMKFFAEQQFNEEWPFDMTNARAMTRRRRWRKGEVFRGDSDPSCRGVPFALCSSHSYLTPWHKGCTLMWTEYLGWRLYGLRKGGVECVRTSLRRERSQELIREARQRTCESTNTATVYISYWGKRLTV